jgi:hypothetical protein
MMDDDVLYIVLILDRSVIIHTFRSSNDFVLDLVLSKSASVADDTVVQNTF